MKKILFTTMIAAGLFACQTNNYTLKPAFDLTKAKAEIEAANNEIAGHFKNSDSTAMSLSYAKGGVLFQNNYEPVKGTDKLTSFWGEHFRSGINSIKLTTLEVWGDENYVSEEGRFEVGSKDGKVLDHGSYIVIWKKEDGKWKLYRDLSNSELPLATH